MTPLEWVLAQDWTPLAVLVLFAVTAVFCGRQIRNYHPVDVSPRPDRHLPESDYRLLGDDYRDHAAEFFHGQVERDERLARALDRTCFAKNEGRDVSASGPLTSKEPIHASENQ